MAMPMVVPHTQQISKEVGYHIVIVNITSGSSSICKLSIGLEIISVPNKDVPTRPCKYINKGLNEPNSEFANFGRHCRHCPNE